MRDEDVDKLFNKAATIGYAYSIDLIGEDSIVAMRTFKLSDTEHIIHELAHCKLWGLDVRRTNVMVLLEKFEKRTPHSEQEHHTNEIESFAVTMEVLRQLGAADEVDELAFFNSLEIAIHGYEPQGHGEAPNRYDLSSYKKWWDKAVLADLRTFHTTERGKAAVTEILKLFEEVS